MSFSLAQRLGAEFRGTFWLVLGGCGSAVLAAVFPEIGTGFVAVSLAFGLTVLTVAYAVGDVSGGHFNPAVTIGLATAGRFGWGDVAGYIVTQVGAAAAVLFFIPSGKAGFAPVAIGLGLVLTHLISIPVTHTSVNPARSTGLALFATTGALGQLWLFQVARILGGALGGIVYRWLGGNQQA